MSTITSANSVVTLSVAGLFPVPQQLHGYSADRAWETGNVTYTESQIGVDGRKTGGFIFNQVEQTFTLQADSPSKTIFQAIVNAMKASREIYYISGTIDLPATGESFICVKGSLKDANVLPDGGKVLQAVKFVIEWQRIDSTLS
jgi:hypothetical protein